MRLRPGWWLAARGPGGGGRVLGAGRLRRNSRERRVGWRGHASHVSRSNVNKNPFVSFMASSAGRGARVVAGIVLIVLGIWPIGGALGVIVAIVGLVPLLAGAFDVCVLAPLFGQPFQGKDIRSS